MATKEYTKQDMLKDFLKPSEYVKASDLSGKGDLTVKEIALTENEEYGKAYQVYFDSADGKSFVSYISAKQPFEVFDELGDKLIDSVVRFEKTTTKDKKTIVKMRLVIAGANLNA